MAKLSRAEAKAHAEAEAILAKDRLSDDERLFVMENWQEGANHVNSAAGAFFTPWGLARDAALDVHTSGRVIDLCAGMGSLSLAVFWRDFYARRDMGKTLELVCVELNPAYVEVGRKMLPEARWVCASIFDLPRDLGHFDSAISNPPFGKVKRDGNAPRYTGAEFEYHVIDIASDLADFGVFIIPQMSSGFRYSGAPYYSRAEDVRKYASFHAATGIHLEAGVGVDTSIYDDEWHGVSPRVEVACAEFIDLRRAVADGASLDFGDWKSGSIPEQVGGGSEGLRLADADGLVAHLHVDDELPPALWDDGALEVAAPAAQHLPSVAERDELADGMPELVAHGVSVDAATDGGLRG